MERKRPTTATATATSTKANAWRERECLVEKDDKRIITTRTINRASAGFCTSNCDGPVVFECGCRIYAGVPWQM
jgi:hypothetical protein